METEDTLPGPSLDEWKPPYIPFRTLLNLLLRLQEGDQPPRIDRSFLSNMAGTTQTQLLATLRGFGLIEEDGTVTGLLVEMTSSDEARRSLLAEVLRQQYPEAIRVAKANGTMQMLQETFGRYGLAAEPKRKAVTFFLNAAKYAELPLSPHFKLPRERSLKTTSSAGKVRKKRPAEKKTDESASGSSSNVVARKGDWVDEAKQRYVEMLLEKASSEDSPELLDRIEELLGFGSSEGGQG